MQHEAITEKVIGCADQVYNQTGYGFLESVYGKCLVIELRKAGIAVARQHPIKVYYSGEVVGEFVADLVVHDEVIVELKSVRRIIKAHEVQLVNYLVSTKKEVGLILNFSEKEVEVKRKVRTLDQTH